jgi:CDP-diacylglycerol--serine O-phosphatidyltransferase
MTESREPRIRQGFRRRAYLLPSIITVGNLLLGFYAVILGLRGEFQTAVLLVFVAAFVDGMDGRLARKLQTESDFGREYDSLADVVTFGTAPPLLIFLWTLRDLERVGWAVPAFFLVCAATRLARFNVQTRIVDKRFFAGLPVPAAAGSLGSLLYFSIEIEAQERFGTFPVQAAFLFFCVALGLLMVSGFRYYSFKELDPQRRWTFRIALPIAAIGLLALLQPATFFLVGSSSYVLWGPVLWLRGWLRRWRHDSDPESVGGDQEPTGTGTDRP